MPTPQNGQTESINSSANSFVGLALKGLNNFDWATGVSCAEYNKVKSRKNVRPPYVWLADSFLFSNALERGRDATLVERIL